MKNPEKTNGFWKRFIQMLVKSRLPWIWIVISFAITVGNSAIYLLVPDYTNQVLDGDLSNRTITIFIFTLIASFLLSTAAYWLQEIAGAKITRAMRKSIWRKITLLSIADVEKKGAKELISRTTTDTEQLARIFASSLPGIAATIYYVIGAIRQVGDYEKSLSLVFIVVTLSQVVLAFVSGHVVFKMREKTQRKLSEMTEGIAEVMSNIPLVKIFTAESTEEKRGHSLIYGYNKSSFNTQMVSNIFTYTAQFLNLIGILVIVIYGAVLVRGGKIDVSMWIAYFMYYYYAKNNLQMMPYYWKELKEIQGSVSRLSEITEMIEEDKDSGVEVKPEKKDFNVESLSFEYDDTPIFENVSFTIPYGKTVALVGENGAGKTTFIKLLERFYAPKSGTISYGEQDMESISIRSWRNLFSYVPQDVRLMAGTIRDNLTYGVEREITDEELDRVCDQVQLKAFINTLPDGYETVIEDFGDNISGGQRQKIAIARAVLLDKECLLLDEYTSSLDTESTDQVQEVLNTLKGMKTILLIAHNMESIRNADSIVVLADGVVEAIGTHDELINISDVYKKLLFAQNNEEGGQEDE